MRGFLVAGGMRARGAVAWLCGLAVAGCGGPGASGAAGGVDGGPAARGLDAGMAVGSVARADLKAIWGSGPDDVWVVGSGGTILHSNGHTWAAATSGASENLTGIQGTAANDVWVCGDQ